MSMSADIPQYQGISIRVFISSTFRDMMAERDYPMLLIIYSGQDKGI